LSKTFPSNYYENKEKFKQITAFNENNTWHIVFVKNKLIGALLTKDIILNYFGSKFFGCGMSYMAIDPEYQSMTVSKILKKCLEDKSNKKDLTIGFARKVMDGYWKPYGFLGISNFSKSEFLLSDIRVNEANSDIEIIRYNHSYLKRLKDIYNQDNIYLAGNFYRNNSHWNDIFSYKEKTDFFVFNYKNQFVGYMFVKKNIINEFKFNPLFYKEIIRGIKIHFLNNSYEKIVFELNLNSPILNFLKQYSFSEYKRYAFEGGHIVKITSYKKILEKLSPSLLFKIKSANLMPFTLNVYNVDIIFDGKKLSFKFNETYSLSLSDQFNLTKLIFGLHNSEEIKVKIMFPNSNFQVPFYDEV